LVGSTDPARSGYQAFVPLPLASVSPLASPAAVRRSHSATVPGFLASALSDSPSVARLSCRLLPDSPYCPLPASMLLSDSLFHRSPPSVFGFLPRFRSLLPP